MSRQPTKQPPEANRDHDDPVLLVADVEHPTVHDVLVLIGQRPVAPVRLGGAVARVIVGTAVQVQRRREDERHLLPLEEAVYLAVVVHEQVALEGRPRRREAVHPLELLALGVERGYFAGESDDG